MTSISDERIAALLARRDEVQAQLASGELPSDRFIALSKEYAEVEPVAVAAAEIGRLRAELEDLNALLADPATEDEMRTLLNEEAHSIKEKLPAAERARWR